MTLKEKLTEEIQNLSPAELMALQNVVEAFRKTLPEQPVSESGHLLTRKALTSLSGNLAEDVIMAREERV